MNLELLTVSDCPNRETMLRRIRTALDALGNPPVAITERTIDDLAAARAAGMLGSPTVLLDGRDPFAHDDSSPSVSCRLYPSSDGLRGAPALDELVAVLSTALSAADDE